MDGPVDSAMEGGSPRNRGASRVVRSVIQIGISVALLGLVIGHVGDEALLDSLRRGARRWWWLLAALTLPPALGYCITVYRFRLLLGAQGISLRMSEVFRATLIGTYFNQLLPTSVGGDAYLAWSIGRRVGRFADVFSSILMARVVGIMAMCTLGLAGSALRPEWLARIPVLWYCVAGMVGIVVAGLLVILWIKPAPVEPDGGALVLRRKWFRLATAIARYRSCPRALGIAMVCSLALQIEIVFQYWVFGRCLGINLPFDRCLLVVPLVSLAAMAPFTFNGIGVREWVMIWICAPLGIGDADAAVIAWLFLAGIMVYAVAGALVFGRSVARSGPVQAPVSTLPR